jgi:phosphoglycolate phosphatase
MTEFDTLIFDFDYTLADSSEAVVECVNYALQKLRLPKQNPHEIKRTIGRSLPQTFEIFSGHGCSQAVEEFRKYFREMADQVMTAKTRIFGYVPDTVRLLHESDLRLAIVSIKFRYRMMEILTRENLDKYFSLIVGGEDVDQHKPHPEGLLKAIDRLKANKARTLYMGDSRVDAEAAERAGIAFLAVVSGTTTREEFSGFSPIGFISHLGKIGEFLRLV